MAHRCFPRFALNLRPACSPSNSRIGFPTKSLFHTVNTMQAVKNTLAENFGGAAQSLAGENSFSLEQCPSLDGKVALITGGSEGIGYGASYTLLKNNIKKLFLLSVSKEVVAGATDAIRKELGEQAASKVVWLQCDLAEWSKIPGIVDQVKSQTDRLDMLFNNSARGIMTHQLTEYGIDRHMAINHIGHVILTSHLLPLLKKTAQGGDKVRIVNQASNAHQFVPKDLKFASVDELNQDLGANPQYGRSKLANILYSRYLARHLSVTYPNIIVTATHPGFVRTKMSAEDIHEPFPLGGYGMSVAMAPFQKDQFEGALSGVYALTLASKSGDFICPPATIEPGSDLSRDEALGEQLMHLTREIISQKTDAVKQGCPLKDF